MATEDSTAQSNVITSALFESRGTWHAMNNYTVGIGDMARDAWLKQNNLDNQAGIGAGVCISVDKEGQIQGSRLFLSSKAVWTTGQKASSIWVHGPPEVDVSFNFPAGSVTFPTFGDTRNISPWMDGAKYMQLSSNKVLLSREEWDEIEGVKQGISVRFMIYPASVDQYLIQVIKSRLTDWKV